MNNKILFYTNLLLLLFLTSCQQLFFQERENIIRLGIIKEIGVNYVSVGGVLLDISDKEDSPVQAYGHCWSDTNSEPTLVDLSSDFGQPSRFGEFNTQMQELIPEKSYFIRAYAQSSKGEEYTNEVFTIIPGLARTTSVFNITGTDAIAEGTLSTLVTSVNTYGHCWAKGRNPTISDTRTNFSALPLEPFISEITGLEPNSTYFVRTYMIDNNGIPNYGELIKVETGL